MLNNDSVKLNKDYNAAYMRYQAAILEYQAACSSGISKQIEESRNKCHDTLDIYLDTIYSILAFTNNSPNSNAY